MKKIFSFVMALMLCVGLLTLSVNAASNATLSGPNTVRAGDTITLSFKVNGSGLFGGSGALAYDKSQVELTGTKTVIAAPWMVEFSGDTFVFYDNNLEKPINKNTELFTATFKVKNIEAGTKLTISCKDVVVSDGNKDTNIGTVSYSTTIAAPKSKDNTLKSLTVSNATISPAFSADVTSYSAEVPFTVSKLQITAVANDANASVSLSNPTLTPGGTTNVKVTVTAENGSTKVYTISVKRAADPNYVPSGNNKLTGIKVDGFVLSPVFDAGMTEYIVWLPYEVSKVTVSGTAADKNASVRVEGGNDLTAGADNVIKVICVAENGTEKVYTVIAKRAAAHGSVATQPSTAPSSAPTTIPTTVQTNGTTVTPTTAPGAQEPAQNEGGMPVWTVIVAAVAAFAIGLGIGISIKKKKD